MKIHTAYSVKIKEYNHIFDGTVRLYRGAVAFFMDVMEKEWESFAVFHSQTAAVNLASPCGRKANWKHAISVV